MRSNEVVIGDFTIKSSLARGVYDRNYFLDGEGNCNPETVQATGVGYTEQYRNCTYVEHGYFSDITNYWAVDQWECDQWTPKTRYIECDAGHTIYCDRSSDKAWYWCLQEKDFSSTSRCAYWSKSYSNWNRCGCEYKITTPEFVASDVIVNSQVCADRRDRRDQEDLASCFQETEIYYKGDLIFTRTYEESFEQPGNEIFSWRSKEVVPGTNLRIDFKDESYSDRNEYEGCSWVENRYYIDIPEDGIEVSLSSTRNGNSFISNSTPSITQGDDEKIYVKVVNNNAEGYFAKVVLNVGVPVNIFSGRDIYKEKLTQLVDVNVGVNYYEFTLPSAVAISEMLVQPSLEVSMRPEMLSGLNVKTYDIKVETEYCDNNVRERKYVDTKWYPAENMDAPVLDVVIGDVITYKVIPSDIGDIRELEGFLQEKIDYIASLDLSIKEQADLILSLNLKANEQAVIIEELHTLVEDRAALIDALQLETENQIRLIVALEMNVEEKAVLINALQLESEEQARIVNELSLNLVEKALLIDRLTVTTEEQAELIKAMKISFADQADIINELDLTIQEDAVLITELTDSNEDMGELIGELRRTVEEDAELITELRVSNDAQAMIISNIRISLEEQEDLVSELKLNNDDQQAMIGRLAELNQDNIRNSQRIFVTMGAIIVLLSGIVGWFILKRK